jgi:hypothetical protein
MGGSSSGPKKIGDVKQLIERAKEELRSKDEARKRNVFISFAYEDINEVNLLRGQAKNENSPIEFNDWSVSEPYNSERAPYIKQRIAERIAQSSLTVVYISPYSSRSEWVNWEVSESLRLNKTVIGVYSGSVAPTSMPSEITKNGVKCVSWSSLAATISQLK